MLSMTQQISAPPGKPDLSAVVIPNEARDLHLKVTFHASFRKGGFTSFVRAGTTKRSQHLSPRRSRLRFAPTIGGGEARSKTPRTMHEFLPSPKPARRASHPGNRTAIHFWVYTRSPPFGSIAKSSNPSELKSPGTIPSSSKVSGNFTVVSCWKVPSPLPFKIAKKGW